MRAPSRSSAHRASICFGKTIWQHADHADRGRSPSSSARRPASSSASGSRATRCCPPCFDPYIKMLNALPRVVLAPIFMLWLGLGIWSKVALGVTLVFFIVFFNVYQGVKEVSPVDPRQRPHARHERAPAVAPRLLALGAVLDVLLAAHLRGLCHHRRRGGRIPGLGRRPRLPDPAGGRHLRHDGVFRRYGHPRRLRAGHRLAGDADRESPAGLAAAPAHGSASERKRSGETE